MRKITILLIAIVLCGISTGNVFAACPDVTVTISAPDHAMIGVTNFSYTLTNDLSSTQNVRVTEIIGGVERTPTDHTLAGNEVKPIFSQFTTSMVGSLTIGIMLNENPSCITTETVEIHNFQIDTWTTRKFYYPSSSDEVIFVISCINLGSPQDFDLGLELLDSEGTTKALLPYGNGTDIFPYDEADTPPNRLSSFAGSIKFGARYKTSPSEKVGTWKFKATMKLEGTSLVTFPSQKDTPPIDENGYLSINMYNPNIEVYLSNIDGDMLSSFIFTYEERNDFKIVCSNLSNRQLTVDFEVYIYDGGIQKWKYIPNDTYPTLCCKIFDSVGELQSKQSILVMMQPSASDSLTIGKEYTLKIIARIQGTTVSKETAASLQFVTTQPAVIRKIQVMRNGMWETAENKPLVPQNEEVMFRILFINQGSIQSVKIECVHIRIIDSRGINIQLNSGSTFTNIVIPPNTAPNNYAEVIIKFNPTIGQEGVGDYTLQMDDCSGNVLWSDYLFTVTVIQEIHAVTITKTVEYVAELPEYTNLKILYALKNTGAFQEIVDITYYLNSQQISLKSVVFLVDEEKTFEYEFQTSGLPTAAVNKFRIEAIMRSTGIDIFQGEEHTFVLLPSPGIIPGGVETSIEVNPQSLRVSDQGALSVKIKNLEQLRRSYDIELADPSPNIGFATTMINNKIIDPLKEYEFTFAFTPNAPSPSTGYIVNIYINGVYVGSVNIIVIPTNVVQQQPQQTGGGTGFLSWVISIGIVIVFVIGGFSLWKRKSGGRGDYEERTREIFEEEEGR